MLTVTLICLAGSVTLAMPAEAAARVTEPVRAAFCAQAHEYGAGFPGDDLWRGLIEEVGRELQG